MASGLVTLALLGALATAAAAAPVTTTTDGGAGSLREAVEKAEPGDAITVPAGTYKLTLGELVIKKGLTLAGAGEGETILEGGGASRVIGVTKTAGEVTLEDLTVRGGRVKSTIAQGAGIFSQAGHLVLRRVEATDNVADATEAGKAGGIAEGGGITVRLESHARLSLIDSVVSDNVADASGDNGMSGGLAEGGGLHFAMAGGLDVSGTTFVGNKVLSRGGGVAEGGGAYIRGNSEPGSLTTSTFVDNFVESGGLAGGGGIAVILGEKDFELDRTTIAGNRVHSTKEAKGLAGGLFAVGIENHPVRVLGDTIVGNSADHGGNVQVGDAVDFGDTVVSGGTSAPGEENCSTVSTIVSLGFNLDSADQCKFHAPGDLVDRDPRLGPLADNGGRTLTMLPAAGSPLIDAGSSFGLTTDQRGLPRPVDDPNVANAAGGDGAEIGAVELPASPLRPPVTGAPPAPAPAPPATPPAAPRLTLGKLVANPKAGTATLTVSFSAPASGRLSLAGKGLMARSRTLAGARTATLILATTGKAHKALVANGRRHVEALVTFAPSGGAAVHGRRGLTLRLAG